MFHPQYHGAPIVVRKMICSDLAEESPIDTGEWQSMNVSGSKLHQTRELLDVTILTPVTTNLPAWQALSEADLPWAEDHFLERVSGQPLNPPPSHVDWPHAVRGNGDHTTEAGQFDHTYPERFWPVFANAGGTHRDSERVVAVPHVGIRFEYGDLGDVAQLLTRFPDTRQAYLPVWFPEDTGGHARVGSPRVPCTLGYHFLIRGGVMSMRYYIRSCDVRRHLHNDLYLAGRLMQWMRLELIVRGGPKVGLGMLTTYVASLHSFVADDSWLRGMMAR